MGLQTLFTSLSLNINIPALDIIVPLGISFYTFHAISYLVSVKRDEVETISFQKVLLFISFFPSFVAGPINRAKDFLPQLSPKKARKIITPHHAFVLIALSFIKVVWLSAILEQNWVSPVFSAPLEAHSLDVLIAVYAYAFQIYLNFSGYTELVTGIAMLLGFQLPKNFEHPYLAVNLQDFWQRWHISLSNFIRDYIYIPLGGNRKGTFRTYFNLMLAMTLSGLWHGASQNFIIWGAIHGAGIGIYKIYHGSALSKKIRLSPFLAKCITFNYVCFSWIFFRSESFNDTKNILTSFGHITAVFSDTQFLNKLLLLFIFILIFIFYPKIADLSGFIKNKAHHVHWLVFPFCLSLVFCVALSLSPSGIPTFIYSRF